MPVSLDQFDQAILRELQTDASISTADLAEKIGLSLSPCWRRVKRLKEDGIIGAEVALLARQSLGLEIDAVAQLTLRNQLVDDRTTFEEWAMSREEIVECLSISGERDYLLRILVTDLAHYEHFLTSQLLALPCVSSANTSFVLREVKSTTAIPLGHLKDH
jgi:DNA-binding Lrp family transcriptional regulator